MAVATATAMAMTMIIIIIMVSRRLTRGSLQHLEDAMHERHLLCVKSIGCMLGMVTILIAGFTAVHHLHLTITTAISWS